jgi:hypothetical protein
MNQNREVIERVRRGIPTLSHVRTDLMFPRP